MTQPQPPSSGPIPEGMIDAIRFAARNPEAFKALSAQVEGDLTQREAFQRSTGYRDLLQSRYNDFQEISSFATGQLAYWKSGLKNKLRPAYGEPCIVTEVRDEPIIDSDSKSGSQYFREPLDMQIGVLDEDRELILFYVDSRRFTADPNKSQLTSEADVSL